MDIKKVVDEAISRYVTVTIGDEGFASGVIIANNVVLTCFHCIHAGNTEKVDGVEAEIIAVDPLHDLALLSVKTKEVKIVKVGSAALGQVVISVSNPTGMEGTLLFGRVCYLDGKRVVHDMHIQPGSSGSGLFNLQGEMVGVNQKGIDNGSWLSVALPSELMKKILSRVVHIVTASTEEVKKYGTIPSPPAGS